MSASTSITCLLTGVKKAEEEAIYALFTRCYERVVDISRRKLSGNSRGANRGFDEDDVANSAFREFLSRAAESKFNKLENRKDFWQILTMLVGDNIKDRLQREGRLKRGGGMSAVTIKDVAEAVSKLNDPSLEAEINDAKQLFLAKLPSDDHRRVVELLAEGRTHEEIAGTLNLSLRSVDRRVEDVRVALPRILGIDAPKKKSSGQRLSRGEPSHEHDA